jgi:biopolymer transport protein ExbD
MARFKKSGGGNVPEINTGSMADIVFILLFFFMIVTTIREASLQVIVHPPKATEVVKLERKNLVSYIYVGRPMNKVLGTDSRIQLNDQIAEVNDIIPFILAERNSRDEVDRPFLTTSLKVDEATKMRIVTQIKQELRLVGAYKISYSTAKVKSISE